MYDIRQFRPTIYVLIALGFTGFSIAAVTPLLWIVSMSLLLLNGWYVHKDTFKPLPRWAANVLTLSAAAFTAMQIYADPGKPIFAIGNFLIVLQLIKLYEVRGNRDYAQLLVLSVLLMVSAVISTASLLFGIIFIAYTLLSPYASLLFHLKVETDHAKRQMGLDEKLADPLTLRQDQRFLHRSMTRLTVMVAAVAIVMAVLVFLFFPRVPGGGFLAWQFHPSMAATGMSEQMSMQSVSRIQQNTTEIGSVSVTRNGKPVTGGELYFRGTIYDLYDGDPASPTRWSWQRLGQQRSPPAATYRPGADDLLSPRTYVERPERDVWVQEFSPLKPTGVSFLIALGGATRISVDRPMRVGFTPSASLIQLDQQMFRAMNYRVISTGVVDYQPRRFVPTPTDPIASNELARALSGNAPSSAVPWHSIIDKRIGDYARQTDVSGTDNDGRPLVDRLPAVAASREGDPSPLNDEIARNIEHHLQTHFTYTLDLADNRPKDDVDDPVVNFLYKSKTGWCEHYAYAMTLMCQSLGINARLVSGYKCDEYNAIGGYFILRQSQAHAWVEVLERQGNDLVWKTFDPTSGTEASSVTRTASAWTRFTHFFDYLEHAWANSVVAYDADAQSGIVDGFENRLVNASIKANTAVHDSGNWFSGLSDWVGQAKYTISEGIIIILVSAMTLVAVGLVIAFLAQRFRLMRRARRIGLDTLDGTEARRLARQLGFYDDLTQILERRHIARPTHLTPLEFGLSLSFLPQEAYETVVRLTHIFYRIRFGQARLSAARRRSLARVIDRLQRQLLATRR